MDFGQGILAAVSKSSNASKELADDGKNILFIDHDSFTIFFNSTKYRLKLSEKAMDTLSQLNEFDVIEFYADDRFRIVYEQFKEPELRASGATALGGALEVLMDCVENEVHIE